ncbi:sporulation protein YabP [Acetivibrio mesophilus]|uniref:Sporulation protein YabP n=1 Tax=Acetivibrio mesophilus TaxID=2487273 RepID=A0A4Q0I524_9FIRM|nr:sporulation protein YabP [Acetivibrio mesophilus]ODM27465.1 sporulation protein YabP [Clostridium sp. Bc-iso-3]RXE59424.1 sporulation protein YabP [Acetivibrio mesophilus]HHV30210.1 sporulation protein YabP [Clostridium sp.]
MVEDKKMQKTGMHNLILENRERLSISGVVDVESFNDEMVVADTELGLLIIRGEDLHINKLSVESSELSIEGYITSCEYNDKDGRSKGMGFFAKMFR